MGAHTLRGAAASPGKPDPLTISIHWPWFGLEMSESGPLVGSILVVLLNLASLWSEAFAVLNLVHEVETAETWCSESANRWRE